MLPSPMQQIDPGQAIMKKVVADLSKQTSAQATEALQQGVPLNNIIEQLLKMTGGGGMSGSAGGPGGGGPQPPGGKKQEEAVPQQNQGTAQPAPSGSTAQGQQQGFDPVMSLLQELLHANQNQQGQQGMTGQAQAPQQQAGGIQPASEPKQPFSGPMGVLKSILPFPFAMKDLMGQKFESNQLDNEEKRQKLTGTEPIQPKDILVEANKLSEQGHLKPGDLFAKFEAASQPFITVRDAHNRVEASAKDPSAAGDLALIFNYLKVLDPGSTVREGEFATAQNSAGITERFRAQYNQTMSGKRLGSKQRADFVDRSRRLFKSQEQQFKSTVKGFSSLAEKNNLDPKIFMRDIGRVSENQGSSRQVGMTGKAKDGTPVQWDGKQWVAK